MPDSLKVSVQICNLNIDFRLMGPYHAVNHNTLNGRSLYYCCNKLIRKLVG